MPDFGSDINLKPGVRIRGNLYLLAGESAGAFILHDAANDQTVMQLDSTGAAILLLGTDPRNQTALATLLQGSKVDIKSPLIGIGAQGDQITINAGNLKLEGAPIGSDHPHVLAADQSGRVFRQTPGGGSAITWHQLPYITTSRPGIINLNTRLVGEFTGAVALRLDFYFGALSNTQYRIAGQATADLALLITDDAAGIQLHPSTLQITSHSLIVIHMSPSGGSQAQHPLSPEAIPLTIERSPAGIVSLRVNHAIGDFIPQLAGASFDCKYTYTHIRQFTSQLQKFTE